MALALKGSLFYNNQYPWNTIVISDDVNSNNYEVVYDEALETISLETTALVPTSNNLFTDEYSGIIWALHSDDGFLNIEQFSSEHLRGSGTSGAKRIGVPFSLKIDSNHDHYEAGSSLSVILIEDETGIESVFDASSFSEIIKDVSDTSTTSSSAIPVGALIIPVQTGHGITSGDVIRINYAGNIEFKYVKLADANNLIIKTSTKFSYALNSQIDLVGNTGIYSSVIICYKAGPHSGIVTSPIGQILVGIEVLEETEVEASLKAQRITEMLEEQTVAAGVNYAGYA